MGGNIFKNIYEVSRLELEDYLKVETNIRDELFNVGIDSYLIPYIKDKKSFGDLDLIIDSKDTELLIKLLEKEFSYPYSINGSVVSIYYTPFKFQIDLIGIRTEDLEYAINYFAWGCAGNLVGRLAKKIGFKHGHRGLYYVQRNADHVIDTIHLSHRYTDILNILEIDVVKFQQGFDSEEDMFQWFTASPYFDIEYFLIENLPNKDRVRDRKRKDYGNFIEWCLTKSFKEPYLIVNKLDFVLHYYPDIEKIIEANIEKIRKDRVIKSKFNGRIVMTLTGLTFKDIGNFLFYFKSKYDNDFIYKTEHSVIEDLIKKELLNFNKSK